MKKQRHQPPDKRPIILAATLLLSCGLLWFTVPHVMALVKQWRASCPQETAAALAGKNQGASLRGNIYDRHGSAMAVSLPLFSVYVKPVELLVNRKQTAFLATALKIAPDTLERQLKSERCVVWLARYISPQIAEEIRQQQIRGLYLISEPQRYYPQGKIGSHVVGCFKDGHGLAGIEFSLDQVLQSSESNGGLADSILSPVPHDKKNRQVILQLDAGLQKVVVKRLAVLREKTAAAAIWGVVMQPDSGAVLAMASLPAYDPNRFWEFSEDTLVNRAVESRLSIGSLTALFSLAEALDSGKSPDGTNGASWTGKRSGGWQKSEAGDFVSDSLGRLLALAPGTSLPKIDKFFQTGLPKTLKSGAAGAGRQEKPATGDRLSTLQLLSGFSSLLNGGRVPQPQLVREICEGGRKARQEKRPSAPEVLHPETSGILRALLTSGGSAPILFCSLREKEGKDRKTDPEQKQAQVPHETTPRDNPFDAVMLGYLPGKKGDCVLAIVLQDGSDAAHFRLESYQATARAILRKSVSVLAAAPVSPNASRLRVNVDAAYASWCTIQEKVADKEQRAEPTKKDLMPKVTGLSLRKALHILQPMGRSFSIKGSGVVVVQNPKPGRPLKNDRINLRLQPDTGSIRSM